MDDKQADKPADTGVVHHKTETITTDYEKIITALAPAIEKLAPLVHAWRDAETNKAETAERGNTNRAIATNVSLVVIVACVAGLAYAAISDGQGATAEKIVIGLMAFLGGLGARR